MQALQLIRVPRWKRQKKKIVFVNVFMDNKEGHSHTAAQRVTHSPHRWDADSPIQRFGISSRHWHTLKEVQQGARDCSEWPVDSV